MKKQYPNKKSWFFPVLICLFILIASFATTANDNVAHIQQDHKNATKQYTMAFSPNALPFYYTSNEIINTHILLLPNSDISIALWQEILENDDTISFYALSSNGISSFRTVQASYILGLRYSYFDPLIDLPIVDSSLSSDSDSHLYIVQFVTQPLPEYQQYIEDNGGIVRHYIAQYAYLVEMDHNTLEEVESLPYVRWVGPFHPAYKLEEFLLEYRENAQETYPLLHYNIQVLDVSQKSEVAEQIKSLGGIVHNADAGKFLLEATLTPDQLFEVIHWDQVLFIDRWGPYESDMNIARQIGGADYLETVAGYTGNGVRGEVFDVGFNLNHVDFASRPLIQHGYVNYEDHGASTSGIVFGDGTGNSIARGLLPEGQGIVADCDTVGLSGSSRYSHTEELLQEPYNAVFQTASVGSPRTTEYTTVSAEIDAMLFDLDLVHCQSQSNSGWQDSRPQAWAKNIISVGGVYHYDTLTKDDDCWCYGASIGPASDGRIKPDLWHFYDDIYTVDGPGSNDYTSSFGGTSGATPIVAGHIGLFLQMWDEGLFGNIVDPEGSVFENRPHMTTTKAMMINAADQYYFTGPSHDKTRMHQGWGMPNVQNMFDLKDKILVINEDDVLVPFEVAQYDVIVEADEPALKVTMTYADPPGNPAVQSQHRINDLTLKVTSPSQVMYYGNSGLLEGIWSTPEGSIDARSQDTKNTVECVYIENPEEGTWSIEVSADELLQDSHIETPELDADFALVVSGIQESSYHPADVNQDGVVNVEDLLLVLAAWGQTGEPGWIPEDIIEDGIVNVVDLLELLANWTQ